MRGLTGSGHVLVLRPSELQPCLALQLLLTENHAGTGTVPLTWTVATSALSLHENKVVCFELLEMEQRDWPAGLTTTELRILEGNLSLSDGRSV